MNWHFVFIFLENQRALDDGLLRFLQFSVNVYYASCLPYNNFAQMEGTSICNSARLQCLFSFQNSTLRFTCIVASIIYFCGVIGKNDGVAIIQ